MTLTLYLSRLVGVSVLLAVLGLAGLLQLVDLLDNAGTLFAAGAGAYGMLRFALWRLPMIIEQILPMGMLAGSLMALFGLVRTNELVAIRAAGVTSYRILIGLMPVALAVTALQFVLADRVTPWAEPRFTAWWRTIEVKAKPPDGVEPARVWMREGTTVIAVNPAGLDPATLSDLTFITLGPDGVLERRMDARAATREDDVWRLHDVQDLRSTGSGFETTRLESAAWPGPVTPETVLDVRQGTKRQSAGRLMAILGGTAPATGSHAFYRTTLQHQFALLLTGPMMLLLAMPAAFGTARHGGAGRGLLLGGVLGLVSLVVDGVLTALGEVGVLPPALAAWTSPLIFICIGGAILLRLEEP